jgi:hypothetical protein
MQLSAVSIMWRKPVNYNPDMTAADKEAESLLLVVPTNDPLIPLTVELGRWDQSDERWEGEWRYTDAGYDDNDPIAWAGVPEIDAELLALKPAEVQ